MYIGRRAVVKGVVMRNALIFGRSFIDEGAFIDSNVVVGYPRQRILLKLIEERRQDYVELIDELSEGASIGSRSVVRFGTVIYEGVMIGRGVRIGHNVLIREDSIVEDNTVIGSYAVLDGPVRVGTGTSIQTGVYIPGGVRIGRNVFIGPRAVFTNDVYPPSRRLVETVVEDGAVIGANATIVAGVVIGKRAVVAAGAVVVRSVPPETVVAGVPARPISTREEYEEKKKRYEESSGFPLR